MPKFVPHSHSTLSTFMNIIILCHQEHMSSEATKERITFVM